MKQLKNIFPFLEFNNKNFGYKHINTITERDKNKNRIQYGNISLFISGNMYPKTDKDFVYAILEQKTEIREYRHKKSYESTYNKQFFSAKTRGELIKKLKNADTNFKFN
jgi:hypothetical protein